MPEKIVPVLAIVSGLSIVLLGSWLLAKRWNKLKAHHHSHAHHHHTPEEISMGSLLALGASGGLVPCPSALVVLLSAIAVDRIALGLALLVFFSLGLAGVLIAIGATVLYGSKLIPDRDSAARHGAFRYLPVASAALIVCVGFVMTGMALKTFRS